MILAFPGRFQDHILPDKLHVINISFLVEKLSKQRGGCGGNVAYNLALLGERPRLVAAVGGDFGDYQRWLTEHGVDLAGVRVFPEETTASGFATTDRADNQIWGFYSGAMRRSRELSLAELAGPAAVACLVAPDDPEAMVRHCREARSAGLPFFFDPSFQVTDLDGESLTAAARGAEALFFNDYEHAVFEQKTGFAGARLFELAQVVVVTLGAGGSRIATAGETLEVPAVPAREVVDPTGAGDAYRAGFLAGWRRRAPLAVCGRMGSLAATYAVEHHGTQNHRYDPAAFARRYAESFGEAPPAAS
ncbi:MAG: carbohydrate kinase family protein [Thermoanaerobaculia bacterium]